MTSRLKMTDTFVMKLEEIQPSQLFISSGKLSQVMKESAPLTIETLRPIPVKKLRNEIIFTDGHTRAFAAYLSGLREIRVFWDEDEMDWEAYEICVEWCKEAGIHTIADLKDRVVSEEEYELLWHRRCDVMHKELEAKRSSK